MDVTDNLGQLTGDGLLEDEDLAVYSWVLEHRQLDQAAIADDLGTTQPEVAHALERLTRTGLVYREPENPLVGHAVAPEAAAAQLAAPLEAEIHRQQANLARIRQDLARFAPRYHDRRRGGGGSVEVIASLPEVRAALNRAAASCTKEVMASQPGGNRVPEAMEEGLARDRVLLERGVRMRTLYHHTSRFNGPSQAYVDAASKLGAEYRTAHELFGRIIVFDRELAFIPPVDGSWGAVAIRDESVVAYLCTIFDQAWDHAQPFTDAASEGLEQVARDIDQTIVRLLAAGLKDETIARRLGMSLRTARRHIADIMEQLAAESRFQAGVAATRAGLLDE